MKNPTNMKQTAVNWLVDQIKSDQNQKVLSASECMKVIEQAKQMEKEQIIKFTEDFVDNFVFAAYDGECYQTKEISEYYNETYKSQNNK